MSPKVRTESESIESRWTAVGGLRMHARVSAAPPHGGVGVPVVLLHGLVVSSRYMLPTLKRLAPFYRVYAPDLPGSGKSDKPTRPLNVGELADALGAWMDAERLGAAVLVGNSLGCQVIADLAARAAQGTGRRVDRTNRRFGGADARSAVLAPAA